MRLSSILPPATLPLYRLSTQERRESMLYRVHYKSRYYPFEGTYKKLVRANSREEVRANWHDIILTDEYRIIKIEKVPEK